MENKTLTAVEWLIQEITKHDSFFTEFFNAEIQQALSIEKKQIIEAYNSGKNILPQNKIGELYYTTKYGKQ